MGEILLNDYIIVIITMSVALAMDAFAVSITDGRDGATGSIRQRLKVATSFGFFQGLLFILGIISLTIVSGNITTYNQYIAGVILIILGARMIKETFEEEPDNCPYPICQQKKCSQVKCLRTGKTNKITFRLLVMFGIATSIDALAAGITYGLIYEQIMLAVICISGVAFLLSYMGATFGRKLGHIIGNKANIFGGILIVILGIKSILS